jgi:IclR family transcriptional regulator, acetate operon repressor
VVGGHQSLAHAIFRAQACQHDPEPRQARRRRESTLNQSIQKAITLLRRTAAHPGGASVSALARDAGVPRATALRLIRTLESEGLLIRIPGRDRVMLGPELVRLARQVDMGTVLREVAGARLGALCDEVAETVTLSIVAHDGHLDLVAQIAGPQHLVPRSWLGQRFPLHASSSGKVLLSTCDEPRLAAVLPRALPALTSHTIRSRKALRAELARVRAQGFATTVDELEEGLSGVSVGIFGAEGALVGTLNVSGLSQRLDQVARERAVKRMRAVAAEIQSELSRSGLNP